MEKIRVKQLLAKQFELYSVLPCALQQKCVKNVWTGFGLIFISGLAAIITKAAAWLIWVLPSLYVVYSGLIIPWHWKIQRIVGGKCKCIRVTKPRLVRNSRYLYLREIREDATDENETIECYVSVSWRTQGVFKDGVVIEAYFDTEKPNELYAWSIVGNSIVA